MLGRTQLARHAWVEAEPPLRKSVAIRDVMQPDGWRTLNTKSLLGGALLGQKKYADAEPLLRVGYKGLKSRAEKLKP